MKQVRTFQLRLPKGPHDATLDCWGSLAGLVMRHMHVRMARLYRTVEALPASERRQAMLDGKNACKRELLRKFSISGRQYNGVEAQLMGLWDSRRALASLDVERLASAVSLREKSLRKIALKLLRDKAARIALDGRRLAAERKGRPKPLPTAGQAKAILDPKTRDAVRFKLHHGRRKLASLRRQMEKARLAAAPHVAPDIVFGGKKQLRARAAIHPNDRQGLLAWRRAWDARRSAGFMLIGGSDEAAGNKSCKLTSGPAGSVVLDLRLPDALVGVGAANRLRIPAVKLEDFGAEQLVAAIAQNASPGRRLALTFRFVRDPDFRHDTLSAWRVCVTLQEELPEPQAFGRWLGVDINVDHLAVALIDGDGNPVAHRRIPLHLHGKSSAQSQALIEEAAIGVVAMAEAGHAAIVLEHLDFDRKKREISQEADRGPVAKRRARTLSSFAYAKIRTAIERRAQRRGVAARSVNPAYTSLIGEVNYSRRYGLTRHQAAAVAIGRRAAGFSERVNYIHGHRGCRSTLPAPAEARKHVWRQWAMIHRERTASAATARRNKPAHPPDRGKAPGLSGRRTSVASGGQHRL